MIRHSTSLGVSILLHSLILILAIYIYKNWPESKKEEEKVVCIKMCHIQEPKPQELPLIPTPAPKTPPVVQKIEKPKPKKIEPKPQVKPKPKKKIPVVEKKEPQEIVQEVQKPQEIEAKEVIQVQETPNAVAKISKVPPPESKRQRAKRLEEEYMNQHIQKIASLLQDNLYYPRSARKRGVTGTIHVKFKLLKNGTISFAKVTSSTSDILTRAALQTIEDLSGKFPHPAEDLTLHVPIEYSLN